MLEPNILPICLLTRDLVNQHGAKQIHWAKDTSHPQMLLCCFASRHQDHKACRSTEVCWTLILEVLSHRVKMRYMKAWIMYSTLHYITPWHANVKNWIVSRIFSPIHRLSIALSAIFFLIQNKKKICLRKAYSWGQNIKKYLLPPEVKPESVLAGPRNPGSTIKPSVLPRTMLSRQVDSFLPSDPSLMFPKAAPNSFTNFCIGFSIPRSSKSFCIGFSTIYQPLPDPFKSLSHSNPAHMSSQGKKKQQSIKCQEKDACFSDLIFSDSQNLLSLTPSLYNHHLFLAHQYFHLAWKTDFWGK